MIIQKKVSQFPARQRHWHLLEAFDNLAVGDTLILEANHNPAPFIHEFQQLRRGGMVQMDEEGPKRWIFRLIKLQEDSERPMPLL
ncbi:Uncharacterized conserved protein, DUF2249 family [Sulfobacillus thermosulfidooxidans DSM 9293]|uniref:Uncharacterized conserved protein, DUF2249 family n=1 Tax=Sulfobacillus thermosulfidooxidans (strain DSM 9293 / VKM B-1269 / AT-1) TaxID=929705 RepID=A0A1W1WGE7_SULTA|nr:DUF2249 domain-containing protein [Sulfobacillus thermosulfidooxidans]SMC04793.1 Uncharacterized conserved protein, DUF2249 family [Sulfobacillus thermosulfidooxidans DSM 9293]